MARLSRDWQYRGSPAVILENAKIRVSILPGIGARIFEFIDKENDSDLLWHNPRRAPEPVTLGAPGADLWWTGGIDDIFPTDFPCTYRNEALPYLGELWTNAWEVQAAEDDGRTAEVRLATRTVISPFEVQKTVRLEGDEESFSVRYSIRNIGFGEYDWYFGVHPGVVVTRGSRLIFPLRNAIIDDTWPAGVLGNKGTVYHWPDCPTAEGGIMDLSTAPGPDAQWWTFHYGFDVKEGFLAVLNPMLRNAYCCTFDRGFFPNILFYLGYGGWRNTYSIIPQIATSYPGALTDAIAAGRHRTLAPGESAETEIRFHCLTGVRNEGDVRAKVARYI